jgi:hypothetical protein
MARNPLTSLLLLLLLPLLLACGGSSGLTIQNGLSVPVEITGLPNGPQSIDSGQSHYLSAQTSPLALRAASELGRHEAAFPLPSEDGQSLWVIGGGSCFILADYSEYYESALDTPPAIRVLELLNKDTQTWTSPGVVGTPPGHRLPPSMEGGQAVALVLVPCEVLSSAEVARGWLEMTLEQVQPSRVAKSQ